MPINRRKISLLRLGTMSRQDADNVNITGGNISGVTFTDNFTTATDPALNAATTQTIIDDYNGVLITLTGAGNNQTLADPSAATVKKFTVINNDTSTNDVTVIANTVSYIISPGKAQTFSWDGDAWGPTDMGIVEIPVLVTQGGTGKATHTEHAILLGEGTSDFSNISVLATGEIVIGVTGADPKTLGANTTTTKKFLASTGDGSNGQDPEWDALEDTATNIKMNGVQAVGSSGKIPHSDHVHPSDTAKVDHSLATAENDFLLGAPSPFGEWVKKTLAQTKAILNVVLTSVAEAVGFTISGGTTSKTLTVLEDTSLYGNPQQVVTVAKSGGMFTSIQSAIDSITDAASDKIYTVLVYPGNYDEAITLKDYVDIIAVNPSNTSILQAVTDNSAEVHSTINITINVSTGVSLTVSHANSIIKFLGFIISTYNNSAGHGITKSAGTLIVKGSTIKLTHADAKAIYAASAQDVKCMNVWANRDVHANITNLVSGGFNYDSNVE